MQWRSAWPIFHGPVILPYILKTTWCMHIILSGYESVRPDVWPKINVDHYDLYFMVQWLCFIPWRLFHVWTSLFGIMNQYDPRHDLKINVGHRDLYFMVQWFCHIMKTIWCMYITLSEYESVRSDVWPQNKCTSLWPIFHGPVIVPYTLKTIWCSTAYFRGMNMYGPTFDLKMNVGHCDLYFMVQWMCLIQWRLFHVWTSLFGIMNQYDPTHDLKINVSWRLFDVVHHTFGVWISTTRSLTSK